MRWMFQGPGVHVVALVPAAGPVPPARRGHLLARWKGVPVAAKAKRVRVALVGGPKTHNTTDILHTIQEEA